MSRGATRTLRTSAQITGGGLCYGALEVLWRGYTHISMIIVGGLCFVLLVRLSKSKLNPAAQCLVGAGIITLIEFAAGCVVNLYMGLAVWDYSRFPFDILGQVCPTFTILWCVLCAALLPACRLTGRLPALLQRHRGPLGPVATAENNNCAISRNKV